MSEIVQIKTLHQLLNYETRKFSIAEIELQNHLPIWIQKANSIKLKSILEKYFEQIKLHVQQLERFFEEESINYLFLKNKIMHAFIEEVEEKINNCMDFQIRDAGILSSIQNINHFKIGSYGTAAAFANALGKSKTAVLFHEFEVNEKQIDDRLSQLAEFEINKSAINTTLLTL